MEKHFQVVPRGVGLVIGCCTFPTWNGFPGFFADLATGNAVVVKPHPAAILPLALTVKIAREVLAEAGYDPNVVTLVAHEAGDAIAQTLALRPEIRIIDFTGSSANGNWLEANARQAQVYTEKSGVNQIVVDSTDDFKGVARNVAFSLALYTGQMCTAPQNIYVPKEGIDTADGHLTFDAVAAGIAEAVQKLLGDPARAVEILGAVVNDGVLQRLRGRKLGDRARYAGDHASALPQARIRTPLVVKLVAANREKYLSEWFGPVAFVIATESTAQSLTIAADAVKSHGALTLSVYRGSAALSTGRSRSRKSGVALSINLTGGVFVNQSAAFSISTAPAPIRRRTLR
jgi:phenylacetic acid degradation protein paaN